MISGEWHYIVSASHSMDRGTHSQPDFHTSYMRVCRQQTIPK